MTPHETLQASQALYGSQFRNPVDLSHSLEQLYQERVIGTGGLTLDEFRFLLTGDLSTLEPNRAYVTARQLIAQTKAFGTQFPFLLEKLEEWEQERKGLKVVAPVSEKDSHRDEVIARDWGHMVALFTKQIPAFHNILCTEDDSRYILHNKQQIPILEIEPTSEVIFIEQSDATVRRCAVFPLLLPGALNKNVSLAELLENSVAQLGYYEQVHRSLAHEDASLLLSKTLFLETDEMMAGLKFGPPKMGDLFSPNGALLITYPKWSTQNDPAKVHGWYIAPDTLHFMARHSMFF